jgi:RNA polymerase sigma factor (sigma-70 family)
MNSVKPKSATWTSGSRNWIALTNRELADAVRTGHPPVLEQLYQEHLADVERVVRAALVRARRFSRADVSDLVQEVFAKAFSPHARAAYDGVREYGPFLRRIAINTAVDWLRRTKREAGRSVELMVTMDVAVPISGGEDDPFSCDLLAATERYVISLRPELKAVHERRFLAADSQEAAARKLGISRQNLRTLERRLLAGLRRELLLVARTEAALPKAATTRWPPRLQSSHSRYGSDAL